MEIVDIDLDIDGNIMPPKNDLIALIDADTIAYTACLNVEQAGELLPREMYADEEWEEIINDPNYDEENQLLYTCDPDQAIEKAKEKIDRILDKTGCQKVELHFSGGKKNFRYTVSPIYKANRSGTRAPAGLHRLKEDLCKIYDGTIHTEYEADDAVVHKADSSKYILCAVDKDVLNSVEGTNFNYYESALYNKEMKFVYIDKNTSVRWRYLQTLMGDNTDNIIGLKGIGPAKASKILKDCRSHQEFWEAVLGAYKKAGRTADEALMNLNLVDMRLLQDDGTIKLRTHEEMKNG